MVAKVDLAQSQKHAWGRPERKVQSSTTRRAEEVTSWNYRKGHPIPMMW